MFGKKWICGRCGAESRGSFCSACGAAKPVKVYVGRRSMNMGDDAGCPNMFSFYLQDEPEAVIDAMYGHGLPTNTSWEGYPGRREPSGSDEDGIQVPGKLSDELIFTIYESKDPHKPVFEFAEGWYERIREHPFIYCQ